MNVIPSALLLAAIAGAAPLFLWSVPAALAVDALLLAAALFDGWRTGRDPLCVERSSPERLSLGAEGDVALVLESRAGRALRLRVTDDLSPGLVREGAEVYERVLPPGETERIDYRVRADARGTLVMGDVHLRVLGALGLVWHQRRISRSDPLRVRPGVREVRRHRLLGMRNHLREAGLRQVRQRGEGGSFESLREYARGDDPRTVDWKATARRGSLMVRRFEAERSQNVLLAIDAGRLMTERIGGRERIDFALSAALLLADVAAGHGDRVGLFVFADRVEQFLPPTRTPLSRIADALGKVEPRLVEPNYPAAFAFLARQLRRRSLLVLFTDLIDVDASGALVAHLGRSASRHLPLAVTLRNPELEETASAPVPDEAAAFRRAAAEELLQARAHALTTMQRAGVLVADASPREAIDAVVNRYLEVKRRRLL